MLLALIITAAAFASLPASASEPSLDFSDPNISYNTKLSPSELISMMLPDAQLGQAETEYVDTYCESVLFYSEAFSNERISAYYSSGDLYVSASEYSYTAANSSKVSFVPEVATLGNTTLPLVPDGEGGYAAVFENVSSSDGTHIAVEYLCQLTIDTYLANSIINFAYDEAVRADEESRKHADELAEYMQAFEKYERYLDQWQQYLYDKASYDEYVKQKAAYDRDHRAYLNYLSALASYESDLAAYEKYQTDHDLYIINKQIYEQKYQANKEAIDKYTAYLIATDKVMNTMSAFESIYIIPKGSRAGNSLYLALQNKTLIAEIENNKTEMVKLYGVRESDINAMSKTANELNALLKKYDEIRTAKSEEERFAFYKENYSQIVNKFNYLYDKLHAIMTPTIFNHINIKVDIQYEDDPEMADYKKWRIKNVLAHIYLVSKCMDDSATAKGTWEFYNNKGEWHTYYFTDLLAPNEMISDNNAASPEGVSWPEKTPAVEIPVPPTPPTEVKKPLVPAVVEEPVEPQKVEEPIAPEHVAHPGEPPQSIGRLAYAQDIINAMKNGELTRRAEFESAPVITVRTSREKLISYNNYAIISFIDYDYSTVLYEMEIADASNFRMPDREPYREQDEAFTYSFRDWSLSADEQVDVAYSGEGDLCAFAIYDRADRYYNITWEAGGAVRTQSVKYGDIPVCPISTDKAPTNTVVYTFVGWNAPIVPVKSNMVYTACYDETKRLYSISFDVLGDVFTRQYEYGAMPTYLNYGQVVYKDLSKYTFVSWDKPFSSVKEDCVYTAVYDKRVLLDSETVTYIEESAGRFYVYTADNEVYFAELLALAREEGRRIEIDFSGATVTLDRAAISALVSDGVDRITMSRSYDRDNAVGLYTVSFFDGEVKKTLSDGEARMKLYMQENEARNTNVSAVYGEALLKKESSYADGYLSFILTPNIPHRTDRVYSISVSVGENGTYLLDVGYASASEALPLDIYPDAGYVVNKIVIKFADGTQTKILSSLDGFVMPKTDITVSISFKLREYRVTFESRGKTICSNLYNLGDTVKVPSIKVGFEENGYYYTFAGWSPKVSLVTGDVIYVAKYNSQLIGNTGDIGNDGAGDAFIQSLALPIAAVSLFALMLIVLAVVMIVTLRRSKKRRKKKKLRAEQKKG